MCLMLIIELDGVDREKAEAIAAACTTHDGLTVSVSSVAGRKGPAKLQLSDEQGGCACGLLADHADWNAPSWTMTLQQLRKRTPPRSCFQRYG